LTWEEDVARAVGNKRAARAASMLEDQASTEVEQGDTDPVLAVEDALRTFPAQEILIVGGEDDAVLELSLLPLGLPVSRVAAARPPEAGDHLGRSARRVVEGRSPATPFALLAGVNLVVLLAVLASWVF
jgi:hypothetical protein